MSLPAAARSRSLPLTGSARAIRWAVIAGLFGIAELLARGGIIDPLVAPPPSKAVVALVQLMPTPEFRTDLTRTAISVGVAFGIGLILGVAFGIVSWKLPVLGGVAEPYLVTLYAMPTLVFYPILLALMGLGPGPIIAIATTMALIPVALNTMVALRGVDPVLPKMGVSVNCSRWQIYRKVLFPAAVPLAVPGVRLGFIYAIIGTIAMEFILADRGLGFRIGLNYREFAIPEMYGLIIFVALLAILVNIGLDLFERRIRRDML